MDCKMTLSTEPYYISKASIGFSETYFEAATGKILMQMKTDAAFLHLQKRKTLAIPDDYSRHIRLHATGKKPERVQIPTRPCNCYTTELIVVKSDFDIYNHVNHSVYIRYSLDAIYSAFSTKYFTSNTDFDDYDVMQVDSL